jgi:hypothetical protein
MANGLLAALSPNEDTTLRRIANGDAHPRSLREADVTRLKRLGLVEESRTGLALSLTGQQRLGGALGSPPANQRHVG